MARLLIQSPNGAESPHTLLNEVVVIGRGVNATLRLEDNRLSRQHCRLEPTGAGYRVVDLGSANGTRVNGMRISQPQDLITGDVIAIGRSRMLYVADSEQDAKDESIDASQTLILPEEELEESPESTTEGSPCYVLQYRKGNGRQILRLGSEPLTIGRHPSCGLAFSDKSVSNKHARIDRVDDVYMIRDLGARNGIHINGRKVDQGVLRPGTRIRIGHVTIGFKELVQRPHLEKPPTERSDEEEPR